jgi:hypothetical protein
MGARAQENQGQGTSKVCGENGRSKRSHATSILQGLDHHLDVCDCDIRRSESLVYQMGATPHTNLSADIGIDGPTCGLNDGPGSGCVSAAGCLIYRRPGVFVSLSSPRGKRATCAGKGDKGC